MQPCPWSVTELLPHRPPMLLLDEVLGFDAEQVQASHTITATAPFLEAEGVPGHIGIEYMAQACGAWAGIRARQAGGLPRIGFLLGARGCRLYRAWFRPGEQLLVSVRLIFQDSTLAGFTGRIDIGGERVAESSLTVYEPPELQGMPV